MPKPSTVIRSRYKGFCWTCHYTIWLNERIRYDGRAKHLDCEVAMKDDTPRQMDPRWARAMGAPKKGRVAFRTGQGARAPRKQKGNRYRKPCSECLDWTRIEDLVKGVCRTCRGSRTVGSRSLSEPADGGTA